MHRRRRHLRRVLFGLGFLASIATVAALLTGLVVDSAAPRSGTTTTHVLTLPELGPAPKTEPRSLEQGLSAAAQAQIRAEEKAQAKAEAEAAAKAAAAAKAKAEAEAQAKAEAEAQAEAEAAAAAEREAAAEEAARSAERAAVDPRSAARSLMSDYGWGDEQFSCLDSLWTKESNWDHRAQNPSSGAYGIPQSLPASKMAEFGDDYRTNPVTQIEWGLSYIDERYGTPCSAWGHSQANNWY